MKSILLGCLFAAVLAAALTTLPAGQARAFDRALAEHEAAVRERCGKQFHNETEYERCVARGDRKADFNTSLDRDRTN